MFFLFKFLHEDYIIIRINNERFFLLEKAEVYKERGNNEYGEKNFDNAIHFYTEGIKVNCKYDELNAKLYNNRAIAHFYLGKPECRAFLCISEF